MSYSSKQISAPSNTAEKAESKLSFKLSPLQWSKFERQLVLTSQSAGVFKITKN